MKRNELIFLTMIVAGSLALAGCGGGGGSDTGAGQGSLISANASDGGTVNVNVDGDIDNIDVTATDQGVVNIDQTNDPSFAIPVESGIDGIAVSNVEQNECIQAGGTPVIDDRGTVCSDGRGGTIPVGG